MKIPDWLHHIPSHWEIRKASHILDISVGGTPPTSNPEFFDGDIPWITIADMNSDEIFGSSHYLSESGLRHANIRWSEPGDLLYSFKLSIGKTCFVKKPVVTNEAIATIHKSSKIHLPFARYVLPLAFEHAAGTNIYGAKILNQQQLKSALIPLPPLDEQKKIADELDRELAEIDDFIADQQYLRELTTEKFNAELRSLTHPEGIETVPLKRFADITLGKMVTPSDKGGMELAPYIRAANIQPGGVFTYQSDQKKMWFSSNELSYLDLKKGDILVVEGGAGFGRSAVLEEDLPGWGFQNSINRVRVRPCLVDAHFIDFCIRAQLLSGELENLTNQSTIPHLTAEKLNLIQIPNIEVGQQTEFANELFILNHRNSILIAEMENLISILLELKQSKIISLLS